MSISKKPPQETIKVKLLHEELAEKYGIKNQEELFDGKGLKPIPKDWLWEMVRIGIKKADNNKPFHFTENKKDKMIVLGFDEEKMPEGFVKEFRENFFVIIKEYIEDQGEDPFDYNRAAVITVEPKGKQLIIRVA